ncbi:MAG: hypothetical protein ACE5J3_07925, partial [Methanosarcinales archaeon]
MKETEAWENYYNILKEAVSHIQNPENFEIQVQSVEVIKELILKNPTLLSFLKYQLKEGNNKIIAAFA